jgi:hypothetical protein
LENASTLLFRKQKHPERKKNQNQNLQRQEKIYSMMPTTVSSEKVAEQTALRPVTRRKYPGV